MSELARSSKQLGQVIQRHRKARGLSQAALAARAGLRQEMVSKIEGGQPGSRLASIYALLAALDLEMTVGSRTRSASADIADIF
ncbi:helix-turn-helix domain-containing protein [Brevundimonas sp.]|uniref:helix-turn-helix domain-containing protein n=1 Tax=Brevundimonas sp. TaxID=1871086 RepID=UPI0019B07E73|nr:helix-turn-helix domain-containing protein [Brevundimonas sp.]MBD3835343.1 helix-turn-helix domain-containing protein [Brevundimonas sp.]